MMSEYNTQYYSVFDIKVMHFSFIEKPEDAPEDPKEDGGKHVVLSISNTHFTDPP